MRKSFIMLISMIILLVLTACGGSKVDESISEKHIAKAKEVIGFVNAGEYEKIHDLFDKDMKEGLPVVDMQKIAPVVEQSGEFEEVNNSSIQEKDGYYVVVLGVKYSEENRIYTISFNKQEEIAGFFIK